jgi:hypothetical protein
MARSLIQAYALAVCFAALMCLVVALGIAGYDLIQIAAPGFTLQPNPWWESNEQYLIYHPDKKELPPQEIARLRDADRIAAIAGERRQATQSLVFVSIVLLIDVVVYIVHWRMAKRREPIGVQASLA